MQEAIFDFQPPVIEKRPNGRYVYRFNIQAIEWPLTPIDEDASPELTTKWACTEVEFGHPLTANSITAAVIAAHFPSGQEQKLVNEYNAACLIDFLPQEEAVAKVEAYRAFLARRAALKAMVDADCAALGID